MAAGWRLGIYYPSSYIKSLQASGYLLPRLGFIIRSHPEVAVGRHRGIPMGPVGFLLQSQPSIKVHHTWSQLKILLSVSLLFSVAMPAYGHGQGKKRVSAQIDE